MFCLKCAPLLPVGLCICVFLFLFAIEICFCLYGTVSFLNKVHCHLTQTWLPYLVDSPKIKWLLMAGGSNEALSVDDGFNKPLCIDSNFS